MAFTYAGEWTEGIFSATGQAQTGLAVTLYQSDGATKASLYTDASKGTAQANPKNTDSNGNITFFADPGAYVVSFTPTGGSTVTVPITIPLNPSELSGSGSLDVNARVNVMLDGTSVGKRRAIDFVTGNNITWTVTDVSASEKVTVKLDASSAALTVQDEGTTVSGGYSKVNFVGPGVTVTGDATNSRYNVTVPADTDFDASLLIYPGAWDGAASAILPAGIGIPRATTLMKARLRTSPGNGPAGTTTVTATLTRYVNGVLTNFSDSAGHSVSSITVVLSSTAGSNLQWDGATTGTTNTESTKNLNAGSGWPLNAGDVVNVSLGAVMSGAGANGGSDLTLDLLGA